MLVYYNVTLSPLKYHSAIFSTVIRTISCYVIPDSYYMFKVILNDIVEWNIYHSATQHIDQVIRLLNSIVSMKIQRALICLKRLLYI